MTNTTSISIRRSPWNEAGEVEINLDANKLPAKLLSFDIETFHTSFRRPDKSKVLLAGALEYRLVKSTLTYRKIKYRHFLADQMQELNDFLNSFDGIILGHNLLDFDYRVLEKHIDLARVIPKTIDTLAFIYNRHSYQKGGISLDNLAQKNLGKCKTISGKYISEIWNAGRENEIIEYNKNDCALTKDIWWHMVTHGSITTSPKYFGGEPVFLEPEDYPCLLGLKSQLSFDQWKSHIEDYGRAVFKKREILVADVANASKNPDEKAIFHQLFCSNCRHNFLLASPIDYLLDKETIINCPKCKQNMYLDDAYCGSLHESSYTFTTCHYPLPSKFDWRAAITTERAIKLAKRRRTWRPY